MTKTNESGLVTGTDPNSETAVSGNIYESPTISRLPIHQRPKPSTVCESCPAAVWHVLPMEVRCYCRVMHVLVWSRDDQNALTACDGRDMAIEQMLAMKPK